MPGLFVRLLVAALLFGLAGHAAGRWSAPGEACRAIAQGDAAPGGRDGDALQPCLDSLPDRAALALPPGRWVLHRPLILRRPVVLSTAGVLPGAPRCGDDGVGCAVLVLRMPAAAGPDERAVTVAGAGSVLQHIVVEGGRRDPVRNDEDACHGAARSLMGGVTVTAANVRITGSVLRDMSCYSALVVDPAAAGLRFEGNAVLDNGTHDGRGLWADGMTVIDATDVVISGNVFRDNTDVQIVLGGCLRCTVADNTILSRDAAAFAGLLVHAWPSTSGDYAGTRITGNRIDCGAARRCGFGLGVGGAAWYESPTSGGVITGNSIRRAQVGINVNDVSGPVDIWGNQVSESGGSVQTPCGARQVGAVNVSAASRRFVDPDAMADLPKGAATGVDFTRCLPAVR